MRRVAVPVALVALAALAGSAGCARDLERPTEVVVTRAGSSEARCSPARAAVVLVDFIAAAERGDAEAVQGFLGPGFDRVSIGIGPASVEARSAADVLDHFAQRREQGQRLRVVAVDAASDGTTDVARLLFTLDADADDLEPAERLAGGSGAVDCASGTVVSLVLASPAGPELRGLCEPAPPSARPGSVLACARVT